MKIYAAIITVLLLHTPSICRADSMTLSDAGIDQIDQEWGTPRANRSVGGNPLQIAGKTYTTGVGTHAASTWRIATNGHAQHLTALVGMDDEVKDSENVANFGIDFKVIGDGKLLFDSKPMHAGDPAIAVNVDLTNVKIVQLIVTTTNSNTYCHADWVDASITYTGEKPGAMVTPKEPIEILTPKSPVTPRINGARVVGVRPSHPLLFTIAATGDRPMTFSAQGLPPGIVLDSGTGRISGSVAKPGTYIVKLQASNALGSVQQQLKIVVGNTIALTPPMGWNSWNCFGPSVDDQKVRAAADAMVRSGLIDHGWTYINIDDAWEISSKEPANHCRTSDGRILSNRKFPDMKLLADYIHNKGLRAGLYSSPGPNTCAGYTASYQHEEDDAHQFADWGFDYLKYDWCTYGKIADKIRAGPNAPSQRELYERPYFTMRDALLKQDRDIVFSLCQYGMGNVWEWGHQVGGNCWRTNGDIDNSWNSLSKIAFSQDGREKFAGPGHWNDPDMLEVGIVGGTNKLSPNEQYFQITMWSLLAAPLLIGCDMTKMDDFTINLLSNDEVIAVDQDPLGKPAGRLVDLGNGLEIWARDLEDGSKAIGLFNRGDTASEITVKWTDLGISGLHKVRDLWRQKDLRSHDSTYTTTVGRHGAVMLKIS